MSPAWIRRSCCQRWESWGQPSQQTSFLRPGGLAAEQHHGIDSTAGTVRKTDCSRSPLVHSPDILPKATAVSDACAPEAVVALRQNRAGDERVDSAGRDESETATAPTGHRRNHPAAANSNRRRRLF